MSYKEQKELHELPAKIESLEKEKDTLLQIMGSQEFYANTVPAQQQITKTFRDIESKLVTSYQRWQELENPSSNQ